MTASAAAFAERRLSEISAVKMKIRRGNIVEDISGEDGDL